MSIFNQSYHIFICKYPPLKFEHFRPKGKKTKEISPDWKVAIAKLDSMNLLIVLLVFNIYIKRKFQEHWTKSFIKSVCIPNLTTIKTKSVHYFERCCSFDIRKLDGIKRLHNIDTKHMLPINHSNIVVDKMQTYTHIHILNTMFDTYFAYFSKMIVIFGMYSILWQKDDTNNL